jgi:hypothetical protein
MKNTGKYLTESFSQPSPAPMKNKARLSIMTAFSFDYLHKHMKINQRRPFKRLTVTVFLLRLRCLNEISKSFLHPTISTLFKSMKWWPSPEGGIVLFRLLVSV